MTIERYEVRCTTETTSWVVAASTPEAAKTAARKQNKEANLDSMTSESEKSPKA